MEYANIIGTYRYIDKRTAPSTGTITLVGSKVGKKMFAEITSGFVADYTTKNKLMELGVRDIGSNDRYLKVVQEASTFSAALDGSIVLLEGEAPIAVIESPTSSDVVYCAFYGWLYRIP